MSSDPILKMLAGRVNSGDAWKQISATGELAEPCYAFIPVNGDATFSTIEESGVDKSANNTSGNYYQNITYVGSYTHLVLATGEIICYLGKG